LWFGESFQYDKMSPANWLVEVSGIPFGLMGDMLHAGGNRWLGMLFGMTVRHPWMTEGVTCDPRPIWKILDEFQIQKAEMIGFWEDSPLVTTNDDEVKVTTFLRKDSILLAIGNFSDLPKAVSLNIDFEKLGIDVKTSELTAPEIKDFQTAYKWKPNEKITIRPRKGWLVYLK